MISFHLWLLHSQEAHTDNSVKGKAPSLQIPDMKGERKRNERQKTMTAKQWVH